jgi:hypothetical protein
MNAQSTRRIEVVDEDVPESTSTTHLSRRGQPAHQAFQILRFTFVIAPLLAGIDKFFHFLVNWDMYLSPTFSRFLPVSGHTFMLVVGGIEILAGLIVAMKPRIGGYIVMAWLWGIIINLLSIPGYLDVALRDFGLSLGALALARLSDLYDRDMD